MSERELQKSIEAYAEALKIVGDEIDTQIRLYNMPPMVVDMLLNDLRKKYGLKAFETRLRGTYDASP